MQKGKNEGMQNNAPKRSKKGEFLSWTGVIVVALIIAILIRVFVFEFVVVQQSSMYPTLQENEKLFLLKTSYWFHEPERGDIVIVKVEEHVRYVKRVIALPGETVKVQDNTVYINDEPLDEKYLSSDLVYPDFEQVQVPEGKIFVMGDNRANSIDSRSPTVGFIDLKDVSGKITFRFSPFTKF